MMERLNGQENRGLLQPGPRTGRVFVPSSKSQLHRLLIFSALGKKPVQIGFQGLSGDIKATAGCLNALGAKIEAVFDDPARPLAGGTLIVDPLDRSAIREGAVLDCAESGSTLRFLLPIAGMLGASCLFLRRGRLPQRPLAPYDEQLRANGMQIREEGPDLKVSGRLQGGRYVLPGNISSQYISGILMTMGGFRGQSFLQVEGNMESTHYVRMTEDMLQRAGISLHKEESLSAHGTPVTCWSAPGGQIYSMPPSVRAEGDWSAATFFLCMGALSEEGVLVQGLDPSSVQGDRAVLEVLRRFGAEVSVGEEGVFVVKDRLRGIELDAAQIPDAVPALAAVAALCEGDTRIFNAGRLRLKESDRIRSTVSMIRALGGAAEEGQDSLTIHGRPSLEGGDVDSFGDHRIAMAAAVAACGCRGPVTVAEPACVAKSYPLFWDDLAQLRLIR